MRACVWLSESAHDDDCHLDEVGGKKGLTSAKLSNRSLAIITKYGCQPLDLRVWMVGSCFFFSFFLKIQNTKEKE